MIKCLQYNRYMIFSDTNISHTWRWKHIADFDRGLMNFQFCYEYIYRPVSNTRLVIFFLYTTYIHTISKVMHISINVVYEMTTNERKSNIRPLHIHFPIRVLLTKNRQFRQYKTVLVPDKNLYINLKYGISFREN